MNALVLIPTYNEVASIGPLIEDLLALSANVDILVIDDNSPDGTAALVEAFQSPRVFLLKRDSKSGLGAAYRSGFLWAEKNGPYTHLVTMDGDRSHRPEDLGPMLSRAENVEVVLGTRWMLGGGIRNWPLRRQLISRVGTAYAKLALKLPYNDLTGGFRVYSTNLLARINIEAIKSEGYCFQIEMVRAAWANDATFAQVPIIFVERQSGVSKMSRAIVREALVKVTLWGWQTRRRNTADKLHYVK